MFSKYDKALTTVLGVVVSFLYYYQVSNPSAWVSAAIAVATAVLTYATPNKTT